MADVYEPSRGGTRGGHDQFSWEKVKLDKDRENYLGHSLKAPVGRSQGGPDFLWYTREKSGKAPVSSKDAITEEKRKIKEVEEKAMASALGPSYSYLTKSSQQGSESFRYLLTPTPKTREETKGGRTTKGESHRMAPGKSRRTTREDDRGTGRHRRRSRRDRDH